VRRECREAPHAFLFFGVFSGFEETFPEVRKLIVERFGAIHPQGESPSYPFPETRTYRRTMGSGLRRKFYVLEDLWPQTCLARAKHASLDMEKIIEESHEFPVERPVNIDPGLVNDCRVLLASTKDYSHRIYRESGIWEEVTLVFEKGEYRSLPWTYPDFNSPAYHEFFERFRNELLERLRREAGTGDP